MATGQVLFQRFFYTKSFVKHSMEVRLPPVFLSLRNVLTGNLGLLRCPLLRGTSTCLPVAALYLGGWEAPCTAEGFFPSGLFLRVHGS